MAAKDVDEFCDPAHPKPITYEDIQDAALKLKEYIEPTPCEAAHCSKNYNMILTYKLENMHKSGSFKERGCLYTLLNLPEDKKKKGVTVGTLGNEGFAMSHHCQSLKIPLLVVMPKWVSIYYQEKCIALGAEVVLNGVNLKDAMNHARVLSKKSGRTYINGRDHPHMLTGNGTIALEILKQVPKVDAILIPIGTGGLAASVGTVIKTVKPDCVIYGVQPQAASLYFKNSAKRKPANVVNNPTLAESIAVTALEANSLPVAMAHVDKLLMVKEEWIAQAMLHMFNQQHRVVEGAAACPLAAIFGGLVPELRSKNVVAIITGGNVNPTYFSRYLELGLSAEGGIVNFSVLIPDSNKSLLYLLDLLAEGKWDVLIQSQYRKWIAKEFQIEINLVCTTLDLEHALTLRRLIQKEYPNSCVFHNEIFTDKNTCECFTYKGITADKRPIHPTKKPQDPDNLPENLPENVETPADPVKSQEDLSLPGYCLIVKDYIKPDDIEEELKLKKNKAHI